MKFVYYSYFLIIIIIVFISIISKNAKHTSSNANAPKYEKPDNPEAIMGAKPSIRFPERHEHRHSEKDMHRHELEIERSTKSNYKERRIQQDYLMTDAASSDDCSYAHDEFDEEQTYDDCSYAHDTSYSAHPSDGCAYTHSDIIGTKAVTQMKTNGRSGMVAYKASHGGMRTIPAFSMSGEEIRAGKKVNIVSVRNGIAIVSETMS